MLRSACRVALVEPGDVFLFSGAQAHATLVLGDELCLGAYESFISLSPLHDQVFLHTNCAAMHYEECHAEAIDLKDIQLDIADQIIIACEQLPALELSSTKRLGRGLSSAPSCCSSLCTAARARQLPEQALLR